VSYIKEGEVFVKMPLPIKLKEDLKTLAFLDGISIKEKVTRLIAAEAIARVDELNEIAEQKKRRSLGLSATTNRSIKTSPSE
jgi:hypothetical protein